MRYGLVEQAWDGLWFGVMLIGAVGMSVWVWKPGDYGALDCILWDALAGQPLLL